MHFKQMNGYHVTVIKLYFFFGYKVNINISNSFTVSKVLKQWTHVEINGFILGYKKSKAEKIEK